MSDSPGGWKPFLEGFVLASLAWVGVIFLYRLFDRPPQSEVALVPPPPTVTPSPTFTPSPLYVHVSGDVHSPGVYMLSPGDRVEDAIRAAGGALPDADLDAIDLAAKLVDGEKIYVPHIGEATPAQRTLRLRKTPTPTVVFPVDINTASLQELEALPRIGPSLAKRIVQNRPYGSIEDIMRVPGIGQSTFDKIKDKITVGK